MLSSVYIRERQRSQKNYFRFRSNIKEPLNFQVVANANGRCEQGFTHLQVCVKDADKMALVRFALYRFKCVTGRSVLSPEIHRQTNNYLKTLLWRLATSD